jgi:TctA family transporter
MWIGNLMLVILNLPLVGIWVRLLRVPYRWLFPSIVMFCCIGQLQRRATTRSICTCARRSACSATCSPSSSASLRRCCSATCSEPLFEEHLRRAMLLARGDPSPFFTRPISWRSCWERRWCSSRWSGNGRRHRICGIAFHLLMLAESNIANHIPVHPIHRRL